MSNPVGIEILDELPLQPLMIVTVDHPAPVKKSMYAFPSTSYSVEAKPRTLPAIVPAFGFKLRENIHRKHRSPDVMVGPI